jgi:hypothetical protein
MNPFGLVITPEPVLHSGHFRLQLFVSSALIATGIPLATGFPERELARYEYPAEIAFRCLARYPLIAW